MAWFGFQSKDEKGKNDAINALNAAFEFRDRFNKEIRPKWIAIWNSDIAEMIPDIRLKCGIHTGNAIIGNLGTERRDQFTAIGPDVNLASRLEGVADGNQIIISTTTKSRVYDHFTCVQIISPKQIQGFPDVKEYFEVNPVNPS